MWRNTSNRERFEALVLPHLDAAFNLARWLTRSDEDAQDMVQESYLRALKFFDGFHGDDARSWLLRIVRNTCYTWLKKNRAQEMAAVFDEEVHSGSGDSANPELLVIGNADRTILLQAMEELPVEWRETLILRELEGLSYRQIASVTDVPIGTVMSRLARARTRLEQIVTRMANETRSKEARHGM
jgi:RNA polymerase sigma factor (sigma-70 family)